MGTDRTWGWNVLNTRDVVDCFAVADEEQPHPLNCQLSASGGIGIGRWAVKTRAFCWGDAKHARRALLAWSSWGRGKVEGGRRKGQKWLEGRKI